MSKTNDIEIRTKFKEMYQQGRYDMKIDIYQKLLEFQNESGSPYTQTFLIDIIGEIFLMD